MAVVEHPTYLEHIREFFEPGDIACMRDEGVDIGTYDGVKFHALRIYFRTKDGTMPPPNLDRRWPKEKVETFYNWMRDDYPRGQAKMNAEFEISPAANRIRKDVASLNEAETKALKKAFKGMMDRETGNPESYFAIAGLHWLPNPGLYCRHHENSYNPWHRMYLLRFEDALRSVPDCENVTLPYWNLTASNVPPLLYEELFEKYEIPVELSSISGRVYSAGYNAGYPENRYSGSDIVKEVRERDISSTINQALGHSFWERFNGWDGGRTQDGIIRAHDTGHGACGSAIANQDIAAFDPMFWFFHANWDRLWWKWQKAFMATSLSAFKTHLSGSTDWLDDPLLNSLPPFDETTGETIDLSSFGVDYAPPEQAEPLLMASMNTLGNMRASDGFRIDRNQLASVRVKGVNRMTIPGTFDVTLRAGESQLGVQSFFQSSHPQQCATCRKNEVVNFDFVVPQDDLTSGRLRVEIRLHRPDGKRTVIPLRTVGDPTINARLLLEG